MRREHHVNCFSPYNSILKTFLLSVVFVVGVFVFGLAACSSKPVDIVDQRCPAGTDSCGPAFGRPLQSRAEPTDRFESLYGVIAKAVDGKKTAADIGDALQAEEIRRTTLLLQGLYKEYLAMSLSKSESKIMERGRQSVKSLEDANGQRTRVNDLVATATLGGASLELIEVLKRDAEQASKDYLHDLRKAGWLPDPNEELQNLRSGLHDFDFDKKKKDQRNQVQALITLADGFRADGKAMDRYFKPKDFSAKDLDNGMHALRRNLRWMTSVIQASSGLYAYTTGAKSTRLVDLEQKYGKLKYVILAEPTKGAYLIDRETMLLLTRYVTELGLLKDFKEAELDISEVINKNNLAKNAGAAEKMAFGIVTKKFGPIDIEAKARALYAEYLKADPLKRLKEDLQAQLDGDPVDRD